MKRYLLPRSAMVLMLSWGPMLIPGHAADRSDARHVITVGPTGAQYVSIQRAVDAAPSNALIRVAAGRYDGAVRVVKPVVIEGSGWDKTTLVLTSGGKPWDFGRLQVELRSRITEAPTDLERRRVREEFKSRIPGEVVRVDGTAGFEISGMKLSLPAVNIPDGLGPAAVVRIVSSECVISNCVIAGSPGDGVCVEGGSALVIRDCLVAGVWSSGILIGGRGGGACRAEIAACDVRNCRYAGIRIRKSGSRTSIERSRVSGAAWHGIRYDDVSPRILANLVFNNARSGIYASGRTSAEVRGNVFRGNGMGGMTCWFENGDVVAGNTFVGNSVAGLSILGTSDPLVRRNVFSGNPFAIACGDIGEESPFTRFQESARVEENCFWGSVTNIARMLKDAESGRMLSRRMTLDGSGGNVQAKPGFKRPDRDDFSLAPGSNAGRLGAGAPDHIAFDSPWDMMPEELAIIPDDGTRDWQKWKRR